MKRTIAAVLTGIAACAALVAPSPPANAVAATLLDTIVAGAPNVPSYGFEATSTSELGTDVDITGPTRINSVQVMMSSWGCEAKSGPNCVTINPGATVGVPITLNIYKAPVEGPDGTMVPGAKIQSIQQTIAVPYRPGSNLAKCPGGQWYNKKDKTCYNGKAFLATWKVKPFKVTVTDDIVVTVSYNTTHRGYNPIGEGAACYSTPQGCIYDSLNVGTGTMINDGARLNPGTTWVNTTYGPDFFCDGTPQLGVLNLDSPTSACSGSFEPAFKVTSY